LTPLTGQYTSLYRESNQIRTELQQRPKRLEYISGIITDLHVDWHRLRGIDARNKLPEVADALRCGNWERLEELILGPRQATQPALRPVQAFMPPVAQSKRTDTSQSFSSELEQMLHK
jgi:hypothetical protein